MKLQYYRVLRLFGLGLAACQLAACQPAAVPQPTLTPSATAAPSHTPQPSATFTPSATVRPLSAVCSPLAEHDIHSLITLYLTQPFIPPQGENKETGHHGVDFAYYRGGPTGGHINGTPVQAMLDGWVAGLGYNPVYGNYVILETPAAWLPAAVAQLYALGTDDALYLLYAHLQQPAPFALGAELSCAEVLGHVGDSGDRFFVSDPHLHLETRHGPAGLQIGAMSYYSTSASEAEQQNYLLWRTSDTFILSDPLWLLTYAAETP